MPATIEDVKQIEAQWEQDRDSPKACAALMALDLPTAAVSCDRLALDPALVDMNVARAIGRFLAKVTLADWRAGRSRNTNWVPVLLWFSKVALWLHHNDRKEETKR